MRRTLTLPAGLAALALVAAGGLATAQPGPPAYAPPPETARLLEGPGLAQAQRHCLACHSADYVTTQPRGMPEAFWAGEVAKMRTAYGAAMTDDDAKAVVQYLTATYGTPTSAAAGRPGS